MDNLTPAPLPPALPLPLPPALPAHGPPRPGWWQRNWKWFVPTGCVSIVLLVAICVFLLVFFVMSVIKSSDPYKIAVQKANTNEEVIQALGEPLSEGMFISGNIHTSGADGAADLSIPITGPKGQGAIVLGATKVDGTWTFPKLEVHVDGTGQKIDLVQSKPTAE